LSRRGGGGARADYSLELVEILVGRVGAYIAPGDHTMIVHDKHIRCIDGVDTHGGMGLLADIDDRPARQRWAGLDGVAHPNCLGLKLVPSPALPIEDDELRIIAGDGMN